MARETAPTRDGYARLRWTGPLLWAMPSTAHTVVFVDIDLQGQDPVLAPTVLRRLRELPHELFNDCHALLVRAPDISQHGQAAPTPEVAAELRDLLASLNNILLINADIAELIEFSSSQDSSLAIRADGLPRHERASLLGRARAAEFDALLERGQGIWRPRGYHYRLPSGRHSGVFVRAGNAFRESRDAYALGTWLAADMADGTGVLIDNASVLPLVQATIELRRMAGHRPGPTAALSSYPATQFDVDRAVRDLSAAGAFRSVLSVSSSGDVLDRIVAAATSYAPDRWGIDVLVARGRQAAEVLSAGAQDTGVPAVRPDGAVTIWTGMADNGTRGSSHCELCTDDRRARLVQIDPGSFEGFVLPEPELTMPNINDANANLRLWEMVEATDAASVQTPPDPSRTSVRPLDPDRVSRMSLHLNLRALMTAPRIADEFRRKAISDHVFDNVQKFGDRSVPPDVIVVDQPTEEPWPEPHAASILGVMREHFQLDDQAVVFADPSRDNTDWPTATAEAVKKANHVLIFAFGMVSGWGLQRLLLEVQELRRQGPKYEISAVTMHARPATNRQWSTLRNSFAHRLWPVWQTFLPDWSPLEHEARLLDNVTYPDDDPEVTEFLVRRSDICNGMAEPTAADSVAELQLDYPKDHRPTYIPLLWGMPDLYDETARIRQMSIFGHKLGSQTLHMAVASAIQRAREGDRAPGIADWHMFEVPAVVRSYYDTLILASFLRWVKPEELWWGIDGDAGKRVVEELLTKVTDTDKRVLLPELLLAAVQGKLPESAARVVLRFTEDVVGRGPTDQWPSSTLVALRAALHTYRCQTGPRAHPDIRPTDATGQAYTLPSHDDISADATLDGLRRIPGVQWLIAELRQSQHRGSAEVLALLLQPQVDLDGMSPIGVLASAADQTGFEAARQRALSALQPPETAATPGPVPPNDSRVASANP